MLLRLASVLAATGCIVPIAAPGSRIDAGHAFKGQSGIRAGAHVASHRHDAKARWDLGAGYAWTAAPKSTYDDPMPSSSRGFYVEGSYLHPIDKAVRLALSPGFAGMYRGPDHAFEPVAYLRTSIEGFNPVATEGESETSCGFAAGTWYGQVGFGAYVDVQRPLFENGVAVLAGLSLRLPAFAGVAMVLPPCGNNDSTTGRSGRSSSVGLDQ